MGFVRRGSTYYLQCYIYRASNFLSLSWRASRIEKAAAKMTASVIVSFDVVRAGWMCFGDGCVISSSKGDHPLFISHVSGQQVRLLD